MKERVLSNSSLSLSTIGLGCATLAFNAEPSAVVQAQQMLNAAKEAGITYFDTAPFYGRGLSERLVGDVLRDMDNVTLSSKVGRILHPDASAKTHMPFRVEYDYSYDGIMRSVEHSFQRLGMHKIDILYAHDLGRYTHGDNADNQFRTFIDSGGYRAMDELRQSGEVKAIGLGVNEIPICEQAMAHGNFDLFLLAGRHTLLERTASIPFFEACERTSTDIVIGGPFNSGLLVGGATYNYGSVPDDIVVRHRALLDYCSEHGVEMGAAAIQFPLRALVVKSVIPGPKNPKELRQILAWNSVKIPETFWSGLEALDG